MSAWTGAAAPAGASTGYDVGVIGGGPAGATAASYLARGGLSVAVFEGQVFPRQHVGESLVPATTPVLLEIGAMDRIDAAGFPRKYGAVWTSAEDRQVPHNGFSGLTHDFRAAEVSYRERAQRGVDRDYTFHVDRGRFDQILLGHAAECGAAVFEGTRVQRVDFADPARPVLRCASAAGSRDVPVRLVVDASGRHTMLGRQLRLKQPDPVFDQYALHTWYDGLDRKALAIGAEWVDYIYVHFLPIKDSWVWQIPITDTVTSIGVVTQKHRFAAANRDREGFFDQCVATHPLLQDELRRADRLRPLKPEGDYSYSMRQICGDGWVLLGDAARFVDPIFASGVSVAMNSARLACRDILAAYRAGDFRRPRFGTYEATLRRGVRQWYEFISLYYRLNVLFTAFVQDPRYRMDVLRMLQGDVYDDGPPAALQAMREICTAVENDPRHLWHPYLGTLRPAEPVF